MLILGIDPGMSGGIAKLKQDGSRWLSSAIQMPATERGIADHLWSMYLEAKESDVEILCFLEHIQPMRHPSAGVAEAFRLHDQGQQECFEDEGSTVISNDADHARDRGLSSDC